MALGLMNIPEVTTQDAELHRSFYLILLAEGPTSKGYEQVCYWHMGNGYSIIEFKS